MNDTNGTNYLYFLFIGALLAILGGYIGDEIRAWRERGRERRAISDTITDELSDIELTIKNLHEVWEQTNIFPQKYIDDLLGGTSSYDGARPRLFLIKKKDIRKELVAFYKKLKDTAKRSEGKVGTLSETDDSKKEQAALEASFQALATEAKSLREKLG